MKRKRNEVWKSVTLAKPTDRTEHVYSMYGYTMLASDVPFEDVQLEVLCGILQAMLYSLDSRFVSFKKYPAYNSAFPLKPGSVADSGLASLPNLISSGSWRD